MVGNILRFKNISTHVYDRGHLKVIRLGHLQVKRHFDFFTYLISQTKKNNETKYQLSKYSCFITGNNLKLVCKPEIFCLQFTGNTVKNAAMQNKFHMQ